MVPGIPDDIFQKYGLESDDFGFSAVNQDELSSIVVPQANPEINTIKEKLDLILEMNSTCEGAVAVKAQYDQLVKARMEEIEKNIIPLLLNLKKNKDKDYIYWPGMQRQAQCDLQLQKILGITRASL
jgi:nitrate reductase alpha subunit